MKKNNPIKKIVANTALNVTSSIANSACIFILHQEKMPTKAKKLRKF